MFESDPNISIQNNVKGIRDIIILKMSDTLLDNIVFAKTIKNISIYNASRVTSELAPSLLEALRLSHQYPERINIVPNYKLDDETTLYIIICPAGLGSEFSHQGPIYYVTYQLDPGLPAPAFSRDTYLKFLSGAIYNWDYSNKNAEYLKKEHVINTLYVPPGFTHSLSTGDLTNGSYIYSENDKQIDVLFLGWDIHERRRLIRDALYGSGLRIWFVSHLDTEAMKQAIRKSKICLNLHYMDKLPCLETIRLNILLSNQACIVSEDIDDPEINIYKDAVTVVPYDKIVQTCVDLVGDPTRRRRMALKSYQWYRSQREWSKIVDFNKLLPSLK